MTLPTVGDTGWGTTINDHLLASGSGEHESDGTHNLSAIAARMYLGSNQNNIAPSDYELVLLDTDSYDTDSITDTANNRITPTTAGYYLCNGQVELTSVQDGIGHNAAIYYNGALASRAMSIPGGTDNICVGVSRIIYFDGVDDYIELLFRMSGGASTTDILAGSTSTYLQVIFLGNR